jgi:hypothetical protein
MNHGDRATPVALARDSQSRRRNCTFRSAIGRLPIDCFEQPRDLVEGGFGLHAVEKPPIDHHAVIDVGLSMI